MIGKIQVRVYLTDKVDVLCPFQIPFENRLILHPFYNQSHLEQVVSFFVSGLMCSKLGIEFATKLSGYRVRYPEGDGRKVSSFIKLQVFPPAYKWCTCS